MSTNGTMPTTAQEIAQALLRTPRDVRRLEVFVDSSEDSRGRRAAQALLAVNGIPWPSDCPLSRGEMRVIEALATGRTVAVLGKDLGLTASSIRSHLANVYTKLGVHDRAQAIIRCYEEGWL